MATINKKESEHVCIDCGAKFVGYGCRRCTKCQRKHAAEGVARLREARRVKLMGNNSQLEKTGWKVCEKCHKKRHLSEYGTSLPGRKGKINKICDRCLTISYASRASLLTFSPEYWRRKAYNANTSGRQRIGRLKGIPMRDVKLEDLKWICKPQDLVEIYNKQNEECEYCGIKLDPSKLEIDHKIPLSRNGEHVKENIALTCHECNRMKNAMTHSEFKDFLKDYIVRVGHKLVEATDKEP